MTDNEPWPGYTPEAQAYEIATRRPRPVRYVTVELFAGSAGYGLNTRSIDPSHRPVTLAEWERIERRVRNGRRPRRTIAGIRNAPRPVLADGRYVDDVLDARHRA